MREILIKIHEVWIETLVSAMMSREVDNKMTLYEFADILFRHFQWVENDLIKNGIDYDYNRETVPIKVDNLTTIINDITKRVSEIDLLLVECNDKALRERISTDFKYIQFKLNSIKDEDVKSSFDMRRKYRDIELSEDATDALTLFLFEESYKEYELIMIYNYLRANCKDAFLNRIFTILIDESFFHLRSFGQMMSEMGILGVPRVVHPSLYKIDDIEKFLVNGIEEEILAKEECVKLSLAVASNSEELSKFFDFINYQENYHIELMRDAVEYFKSLEGDR